MNDTPIQISKRKRNIFVIVCLISLAANFFVLGAGISFYTQGHPHKVTDKTKIVERIEKKFLKRINVDDRPAVREVFKQNREQSKVLFESYYKERENYIAYIKRGEIKEIDLQMISKDLLIQERNLSRHLNAVLQQLILASGPETRKKIAEMIRVRNSHHRTNRSWLPAKERLQRQPEKRYE